MSCGYSRFSDVERTLQSRLAITAPGKVIAIDLGVREETVSRWRRADWPIPAFQAFAVSHIQKDWRFLRALAERWHAVLFPEEKSIAHWSGLQLFSQVVLSFSPFLEIAEKVRDGGTPDDEEQQKLEDEGEKIIRAIKGLIEQGRQKRREKKGKE